MKLNKLVTGLAGVALAAGMAFGEDAQTSFRFAADTRVVKPATVGEGLSCFGEAGATVTVTAPDGTAATLTVGADGRAEWTVPETYGFYALSSGGETATYMVEDDPLNAGIAFGADTRVVKTAKTGERIPCFGAAGEEMTVTAPDGAVTARAFDENGVATWTVPAKTGAYGLAAGGDAATFLVEGRSGDDEDEIVRELEEAFGGDVEVTPQKDAEGNVTNYLVTVTDNITGPVTLPDGVGAVTVDLGGHSILGADGEAGDATTPGGDGGPAITVRGGTELTIVGPGAVTGGNGGDGNPGGKGGAGVFVEPGGKVNVGAGVEVSGGKGGDGVTGADGNGTAGGDGGTGVEGEVGTNDGEISGGDGGAGGEGDPAGGNGGSGGNAVDGDGPASGEGTTEGGDGGNGGTGTEQGGNGGTGGEGETGGNGGNGGTATDEGGMGGNGGNGGTGTAQGGNGGNGGEGETGGNGGNGGTATDEGGTGGNGGNGGTGTDQGGTGGDGGNGDTSGEPGEGGSGADEQHKGADGHQGGPVDEVIAWIATNNVSAVSVIAETNAEGAVTNYAVKVSGDLDGTLRIPGNATNVTVELNGHAIRGADGTPENPDGKPGIEIVDVDGSPATALTIVGSGTVTGGDGADGDPAGRGGPGVRAPDGTTVNVGADVAVSGGRGGKGVTGADGNGTDGGDGGAGVEGDVGTNDGEIAGGDGGEGGEGVVPGEPGEPGKGFSSDEPEVDSVAVTAITVGDGDTATLTVEVTFKAEITSEAFATWAKDNLKVKSSNVLTGLDEAEAKGLEPSAIGEATCAGVTATADLTVEKPSEDAGFYRVTAVEK